MIPVTDFRRIEEGIVLLLDSEFGESNNKKVDDFLNGLRLYLRNRKIKIVPEKINDDIEVEFPTALSPLSVNSNVRMYGSKAKPPKEATPDETTAMSIEPL
jgi:hypothetical protein